MKRFVDIREAETGYRFAWWCTCKDRFEMHNGSQGWDTWDEFAADFEENEADDGVRPNGGGLERYKGLCPEWTFTPAPDEA